MTSREIRQSFLDYFAARDHQVVASASLVPTEDQTLLFTNAGMNQFKEVFLGHERRPYRRAVSAQKCMRVSGKHNDLDTVGPSLRHHTFFEMLGNFSFGDYFKAEAIGFAWELLTDVWGLPADRLRATIFAGDPTVARDDEAAALWRRVLPEDRIDELGASENFWSMGETGPCGRCSEIHYLRGADLPCAAPVCAGTACDCDRYVEVWNNVFMEFDRRADGTLAPLPSPSIDTGMGLERITAVLQGVASNYDTDLFTPLLDAVAERTGHAYARDPAVDVSMRVLADHLRAMTFLIADGVLPSNEWRGYVLRKIMRRAMRHGKRLGATAPFLHSLVAVVTDAMGEAYPALGPSQAAISDVVRREEERFDAVLAAGLPRLEAVLDQAAAGNGTVPGREAFKLYDTLGVPLDFVEDLASERGLEVDRDGFAAAMDAQRQRARASSSFQGEAETYEWPAPDGLQARLREAGDQFVGYETGRVAGLSVLMVWDEEGHAIQVLRAGQSGYVALSSTPFYAESGGQVSDTGRLRGETTATDAIVVGLRLRRDDLPRSHHVRLVTGQLRPGDLVTAEVDSDLRARTRRNHTATHLLHAALREVLGDHVRQAGSLVAPDRLRFDFVHSGPLTREQIEEVERRVNRQVLQNTPVETRIDSTAAAIASGAIALFDQKYADQSRVVTIGGFSQELCGGTHCGATGEIGLFTIEQESGTAAGVRRIEALTGEAALQRAQIRRSRLHALVGALAVPEDQAVETLERLQTELKQAGRAISELRVKAALGASAPGDESPLDVDGVQVLARRADGLDKAALRQLVDRLKARLEAGVLVIASAGDGGKVSVIVSLTGGLKTRLHAGRLVRELAPIVGGSGGGRPDFAEAGGRDAAKIDRLLADAPEAVRRMLAEAGDGQARR